jgi:hypothetical protein
MDRQKSRDPLAELTTVARSELPPALDLQRLEALLTVEFEAARARGELQPRARRADAARRMAPWLAVAALLVLGLGLAREWTSLSHEAAPGDVVTSVAARSLDGDALAFGASVTAGPEQVVRVEHDRRAMWELAAGSGAHMIDGGAGVLCVELERGTLRAFVTPGRAESFVVRARGTEVAVHGTRFSVELEGERVIVSVSEGEVEVRPIERSTRVRLDAGMRSIFVGGVPENTAFAAPALTAPALEAPDHEPATAAAAGARTSELASPELGAAAGRPTRRATSSEAAPRSGARRTPAAAPASEGARAEPLEPSATPAGGEVAPEVADAAIARITEHIQSCFRRHTKGRGPVSIEAATRVSLEVQPNGLILGVSLDPPLAPQVEACVAAELATLNLGASESGYRVRREIRLIP